MDFGRRIIASFRFVCRVGFVPPVTPRRCAYRPELLLLLPTWFSDVLVLLAVIFGRTNIRAAHGTQSSQHRRMLAWFYGRQDEMYHGALVTAVVVVLVPTEWNGLGDDGLVINDAKESIGGRAYFEGDPVGFFGR